MLPERRKKLIVICISILFLVVVVLGIFFITKKIKGNQETLFVSDAYPSDVVYFGLQHDEKKDQDILIGLNSSFEKTEYTLSTFYKILDTKVIDQKLLVYSDAVNEVAYKEDDGKFLFNEVDTFYSNKVDVRLAGSYIVFMSDDGTLAFRKYQQSEKEKNHIIAEGLDKANFIVINNTVFYRDIEGIIGFNMNSLEKQVVVSSSTTFYPYIEDVNDRYILLRSDKRYALYDWVDGEVTYINERFGVENIRIFSLFDKGFLYEREFPYAITAYNAFFKREEGSPYILASGYKVHEMYYISGTSCYLDAVDENGEHKYYIYDVSSNAIVQTLDEAYQKIIKVR